MSAILRHHGSANNFVQVSNDLARHPGMSLKCKGLLLYLLSHRDGWDLSERRLSENLQEGRAAIRSALEEAEEFGYLHREDQERRGDGTMGRARWHVTDDPHSAPWFDYPTTDKPTTDNPTTKKTRSKKTRNPEERRDSDESDSPRQVIKHNDPDLILDLTRHLAKLVRANDYPIPNGDGRKLRGWLVAIDRLVRIGPPGWDGEPPAPDEVRQVMDWACHDDFWWKNIQSAGKFRKQYPRLRNEMKAAKPKDDLYGTDWQGNPTWNGLRIVQ